MELYRKSCINYKSLRHSFIFKIIGSILITFFVFQSGVFASESNNLILESENETVYLQEELSDFLTEEERWILENKNLKVGYVKNYMPFCGTNSNGQITGLITDVINNILTSLNLENTVSITYVGYDSFKEMSEGLQNNDINFSFPVIGEQKYLSEMHIVGTSNIISVPFLVAYNGVIDNTTFDVIALNSRPIRILSDEYPDSKIIQFSTAEESLDAILNGTATCTVMSSYRLKVLLNNVKYKNLKTMPFSSSADYCIGVNADSQILLGMLNRGISFLNKSTIIDSVYMYIQQSSMYTPTDFIKDNLSLVILLIVIFFSVVIGIFIFYMQFIRQSKEDLQTQLENVNILAALSRDYEAIHVADLDSKTFSTMRLSEGLKNSSYVCETVPYVNAVVSMVNQFVLPEIREDFLAFLEIDAMKKRMEEKESFSYRYGIVADGTGNYIYEMTFVRVSNDQNRHILVIGTKCIDNILKFEREQGQYNAALLSECAFFYEFDVADGRIDGNFINKNGYNPLFNLKLKFPMSYDEFNSTRTKELEIYAETEAEALLWTCEGLKNAFKNGKKTVSIRYSSEKLGIYWTATIILSEDETSHHLHAVYICKDVSELVKVEQERKNKLEKALEAAEQANRAKTMFLNNMSHDIRTPMNAILGFADLMEKEKNNPAAVSGYLKKLKNSGEYLLTIINNILDMARIESGKLPIEESFMDLNNAEQFAISTCEDLMHEKKQEFIVTNTIKHPYILADYAKQQQITMNLLSNAIKYTPEGGKIHMNMDELPSEKPGYGTYVLTVEDNGIGMNPEFLEHIFDFFSRERNTTESKIIGTGLGMSIVKKLVDLLNGTIVVESTPSVGSKFVVTFEHKIIENPDAYLNKESKEEEIGDVLTGKHILLVEDNEFNAEIATVILEDFGLEIEHANDGLECIEMVKKSDEKPFDLILMDVQMPNMNGYETTKALRKMTDSYVKDIPIIAMTANAFEEDKKKAFDSGMNAHLAKPISSAGVKNVLEQFLKK